MRNNGPMSYLLLVLRLALGGVFLFAAYQKLGPDVIPNLADPNVKNTAVITPVNDFATSIKAFDIVPDHMIPILTYAIPWTEAICGALLILGLRTRASAFLLMALLGTFIWAIVQVVQSGEHVECGCFGKINFPCEARITDGRCQIIRNGVLTAVAGILFLFGPGAVAFDGVINRSKRRSKHASQAKPVGKPVEKV
ncbi:MAG: DoxX family protein [Phycisphaeraceae bacterium]|nr:DoxX family protein [Phycisphaerales bacterium]MCB9860977.1 DoxX family protein [Phycisphaeraceae bacterium]